MSIKNISNSVLFDLDGTLVDSAPGIVSALRLALAEIGVHPLSDEDEKAVLGPPLHDFLAERIGPELAPSAVAAYREHYTRTHTNNLRSYPGMVDGLQMLLRKGYVLAVCTSKVESFAESILAATGLRPFFSAVCGDTPDRDRNTKAAVIAECLRRLDLDAGGAIMVGDREYDINGAAHHRMASLGVTWGYGSRLELEAAGASAIVEDVEMMLAAIRTEAQRPHDTEERICPAFEHIG